MKKRVIFVVCLCLPLVLLCGRAFGDGPGRDGCGPFLPQGEARNLLKGTLSEMRLPAGKPAMNETAGAYYLAVMVPYYEACIRLEQQAGRFSGDTGLVAAALDKSLADELLLGRLKRWGQAGSCDTKLSGSSAGSFMDLMREVRETAWDDMSSGLSDKSAERSFITVMIAYAQGAADMAKVVMIFESDDELRSIAQHAITLQQASVRSMQPYLKK